MLVATNVARTMPCAYPKLRCARIAVNLACPTAFVPSAAITKVVK
jgi:hypothetical protein